MKTASVILFILIAFVTRGYSQPEAGTGFFTDRDFYVSGETVLAKLYLPESIKSRIVHFDLINQSGRQVNSASIERKGNEVAGYLLLPDSLSSGTYLLRAYWSITGNSSQVVRELWVTNRFSGTNVPQKLQTVQAVNRQVCEPGKQIKISGLKPVFNTNSEARLEISIDEQLLQTVKGNLQISVAQTLPGMQSATYQIGSPDQNNEMTEEKGIIRSGIVTDRKTNLPAANATVYLTIPDSIPVFKYYVTGNDGRFYFLIDKQFGTFQTVIQCYAKDPTQRLKLKLDDLFAPIGQLPELSDFAISPEIQKTIANSIDAVTFQKVFAQEKLLSQPVRKMKTNDYAYYGKPTHVVDPQQFIELPNFSEISRELLPGVKFRNYNNQPSMVVLNNPAHNYFQEPPLLVMDGIPIRDLNVIRNMGSADIDRVEICQNERFYGDLRFPGVVAIYTGKSDYSTIPETDQLIKLNMDGIQIPVQLNETKAPEASIPDLRQTLLWEPSVAPKAILPVTFSTSGINGTFRIYVTGQKKDGTIFSTEQQFEVK